MLPESIQSVGETLRMAAETWPDRAAVTCGETSLDWQSVYRRCCALAGALQRSGVSSGDRIAVLALNSHRQYECYFGPSMIGAIFVPVNYRLALAEMRILLLDCAPTVLVVDDNHIEEARLLASATPSITQLIYAADGETPDGMINYEMFIAGHDGFESSEQDPDNPIVLFYTSGTTGRPKGVMLTHRNLRANSIGVIPGYGLALHEASALIGPMFHTAGGARVYAAPRAATHTIILPRYEAGEFLRLVERHRIAVSQFVPTMLAMLLDHPDFSRYDLGSIRLITYGSAPMPLALLKRVIKAFPGVQLLQAFGMTEASPVLTILAPEHHVTKGPHTKRLESVGRCVDWVQMRFINDDGVDVLPGETGEIVVRGENITPGYWNLPKESAIAIRNGWYHTGDAGWIDPDGFVFLAGRVKDMIVSGGENVYPIETENALSEHPAVDACAVIGIPDDTWGEAVHAIVVLKSGNSATSQDLIEWCRERVAGYKCPKGVTFRDEPLPLSPTNKILKSELREPFWP